MTIEKYTDGGLVLAIVIRKNYQADGIQFFTPNDYSQQLAYMNRPAGYEIDPHVHNEVSRDVKLTQEVLLVRSGRVRVDLYSREKSFLQSVEIVSGDVILLADGGHGFTMLEDSEMIEIKQGPYAGDHDKVRFNPASSTEHDIR